MAHRRAVDTVTFDLVPEDEDPGHAIAGHGPGHGPGHGQGQGPGPEQEQGRHRGPRWLVRHRGAALPAVAAGLAVLLFAADVSGTQDRARREAMTRTPGGVVTLDVLPAESWSVSGIAEPVAMLGGLLVVRVGDALHGVDPVSGERRWSVAAGSRPDCGDAPAGLPSPSDVDLLVCLAGNDLTVVGPDGTVEASRQVSLSSSGPRPGPDGGLVRSARVGPKAPAAPQVRCDDAGTCRLLGDAVLRGRDAVVRLEDAVTGGLRWERRIPFTTPVADDGTIAGCDIVAGPRSGRPLLLYDDLEVVLRGGLLRVIGCGVDAVLAPDGTLLQQPAAALVHAFGTGFVRVLPGSGGPGGQPRTQVLAPDGTVRFEVPGFGTLPATVDGTVPALVAVADAGLVAHAADGRAVPLSDSPTARGLAITAGAVLVEESRTLRAVDLTDGRER